jgi:predicted Zn-dependent peptidase
MSDLKKMIIYAGVDGKNAEKAEDEIRKQLELIKKGVTEEELQRGRQAIKNDLLSICDSPSRIAGWYASRELYGFDETPAEFETKLGLITPDDIARVASSVDLSLVYTLKGTAENEA